MRRLLIFLLFISFTQQAIYAQDHTTVVEAIGRLVDKSDSAFERLHRKITRKVSHVSGKIVTEKWKYFSNSSGLVCMKIEYTIDSTDYSEEYYLDKGSLMYATESELNRYPSLKLEGGSGWGGSYYFDNRKLIHHVTLGHGKSEEDWWEPEKETLKRFDRRYKEYLAMMKNKLY